MRYKMIDGVLWRDGEIKSVGSYETLEALESVLRDMKDGVLVGKYRDVTLQICQDYGDTYMAFCGYRPATPKEIDDNNKYEAKAKKDQEDRDAKEFDRLKKKFEGDK